MWLRKKAAGARTETDEEIIKREQQRTAGRKNYFAVGSPCFDQDQIDRLKAMVDEHAAPAEVGQYGDVGVVKDQRRTMGYSLPRDETHAWVYDIITGVFMAANREMQCDIVPSMNEPIQLLRYDASDQGFFRWHVDTFPDDMTRKMSVVVPLSDPADFEGGKLQFDQGGAIREVAQLPGMPVIFPSWLSHQVTPVTGGKRYSLVAWIRGPNWR